MNFPNDFFYTKDHEWAKLENPTTVTIGITEHAQEALGDIVFVELPKVGRSLKNHETFGVVESIKAVSDLYCPVAGTVIAINDSVIADPALINQKSQSDAWLIKLQISGKEALQDLLSADDYRKYLESLK